MSSAANPLFPEDNSEKLIKWSDKLSVGIQGINQQHKVLVDLLNQLHQAIVHHHGVMPQARLWTNCVSTQKSTLP